MLDTLIFDLLQERENTDQKMYGTICLKAHPGEMSHNNLKF